MIIKAFVLYLYFCYFFNSTQELDIFDNIFGTDKPKFPQQDTKLRLYAYGRTYFLHKCRITFTALPLAVTLVQVLVTMQDQA